MAYNPSELFKILSVDTRIKIIELLKSHGPLGAKRIADEFSVSVSAISQHLKIMKSAGIIESKRNGYHIPYSLNFEHLERCGMLLQNICKCGCNREYDMQNLKEIQPEKANIEKLKEFEKILELKLALIREEIERIKKE